MNKLLKDTCVPVECLVAGPLENNIYIVGPRPCTDSAASVFVVDPGTCAREIVEALQGRKLEAIVLTHAHWDHVGAAKELRDYTDAPVIASTLDAPVISGEVSLDATHRPFTPCPVDIQVEDGDMLSLVDNQWEVILTPGHTPGGICLFLSQEKSKNPQAAPVLFSGDTLFKGTHGRTDFSGGSPKDMRTSLRRLAELPPETIVFPGHNSFTSIEYELSSTLRV